MTPIADCLTLPADKVMDHKAIDQILSSGFSRIPIHEPSHPHSFVGMLLVKRVGTRRIKPIRRHADRLMVAHQLQSRG